MSLGDIFEIVLYLYSQLHYASKWTQMSRYVRSAHLAKERDFGKNNLKPPFYSDFLPSSKYSLWYIEFPIISALVENFSASDSSGSIAPVWVKMRNSPLRTFQADFMRLVFEIPGPIIIAAIAKWTLSDRCGKVWVLNGK